MEILVDGTTKGNEEERCNSACRLINKKKEENNVIFKAVWEEFKMWKFESE